MTEQFSIDVESKQAITSVLVFLKLAYLPLKLCFFCKYVFVGQLSDDSSLTETLLFKRTHIYKNLFDLVHIPS